MDNDPILLNYKSVCLRKSDISCYENYHYLNDLCISFYYEIIADKFMKFESEILLLDPSSVSTIYFDDEIEDLRDCFGALNFEERKYIFIPVNDATDRYAYGSGNHWALVFYAKMTNTFYYLDSMKSYIKNTNEICRKINLLTGNFKDPTIKQVEIPKFQQNTFDCGVFVLNFTEVILKEIYEKNENYISSLDYNVITNEQDKKTLKIEDLITFKNSGQDIITSKRKEIKNLIMGLVKRK